MSRATAERACFHTLFRLAWPRHAAKHAARAAGASVATAKGWVTGRYIPSAETLLRMAEQDEALATAIERRLHDARLAAREAPAEPRAAPALPGLAAAAAARLVRP